MGRLTEYFSMLNSKSLEEDKLLCAHIDCEKDWDTIIEGRKLLRKHKQSELQLFE
jgi:hypothetical protein